MGAFSLGDAKKERDDYLKRVIEKLQSGEAVRLVNPEEAKEISDEVISIKDFDEVALKQAIKYAEDGDYEKSLATFNKSYKGNENSELPQPKVVYKDIEGKKRKSIWERICKLDFSNSKSMKRGKGFEERVYNAIKTYIDNKEVKPEDMEHIIEPLEKMFGSKIKGVEHEGSKNSKRQLINYILKPKKFDDLMEDGKNVEDIGSVISDVTITLENGETGYLSLKSGNTYVLANIGITDIARDLEKGLNNGKRLSDDTKQFIKFFGLDEKTLYNVFESLSIKDKYKDVSQDIDMYSDGDRKRYNDLLIPLQTAYKNTQAKLKARKEKYKETDLKNELRTLEGFSERILNKGNDSYILDFIKQCVGYGYVYMLETVPNGKIEYLDLREKKDLERIFDDNDISYDAWYNGGVGKTFCKLMLLDTNGYLKNNKDNMFQLRNRSGGIIPNVIELQLYFDLEKITKEEGESSEDIA